MQQRKNIIISNLERSLQHNLTPKHPPLIIRDMLGSPLLIEQQMKTIKDKLY